MKKKKSQPKPQSAPAPKASSAVVKAQKAQAAVLSAPEKLEQVLIVGDLATLSAPERVDYYKRVCDSLGINALTRPFEYILFKEYGSNAPAKLSLYARKDCTEQLRRIHRVSVVPPLRKQLSNDYCMVEADLRAADGKTDTATGVVPLFKFKDGQRVPLEGVEYANAVMKAETKAKRRGTLSICGLGILDESELDGVQVVGGVTPEGRIWHTEGYESENYKNGREAARKVLEEKLTGKRPLTEKAPESQPEPQEPPSESESQLPKAIPPPPMAAPASAKWEVSLDWSNEAAPVVMGDPQAIEVLSQDEALGMTWGQDSFWHLAPRNAERLRKYSREFPFTLKEVMPKNQSATPQAQTTTTKRPAPVKETGAEPIVVTGTIEQVSEKMTKGKREDTAKGIKARPASRYLAVLIKTAKDSQWCSLFDSHLFDYARKGAQGTFLVQQSGQFYNLVGFRNLDGKSFDTDGKTEVVYRNQQQRTLF